MSSAFVYWAWITLATLWFVWPFVLLFHKGRSFFRVTTPLIAGYLFYWIWSSQYSQVIGGPEKLGLPFGVDLSPHSIVEFGASYVAGWVRGKMDAKQGKLVLEGYGFGFGAPRAPVFSDETAKSLGIEFLSVSGCLINERLVGHAYGRNDVTITEIKKRFGAKVIADAYEANRRWQEEQAAASEAGRADAERDLRAGRLVLQVYGSVKDEPEYAKAFREKYQIELHHLTDDTSIQNAKSLSWASGYNEAVETELEKRLGKEPLDLLSSMRGGKSYTEAIEQARIF
jgi:hypothetical protein